MATDLPEYYFRTREGGGAGVYRVEFSTRYQRLDLRQIANVNLGQDLIKPHGQHELQPDEIAAIRDWMDERNAVVDARRIDDIHRAVDHLNMTTNWAAQKASDAALEDVTDVLLLAMHDLRNVLVRKKAERLQRQSEAEEAAQTGPSQGQGESA